MKKKWAKTGTQESIRQAMIFFHFQPKCCWSQLGASQMGQAARYVWLGGCHGDVFCGFVE